MAAAAAEHCSERSMSLCPQGQFYVNIGLIGGLLSIIHVIKVFFLCLEIRQSEIASKSPQLQLSLLSPRAKMWKYEVEIIVSLFSKFVAKKRFSSKEIASKKTRKNQTSRGRQNHASSFTEYPLTSCGERIPSSLVTFVYSEE